ncbi:MAG: helix-turn-helix domain-containing protein [Alphaproteobacteria bacterium]
MAIVDRYLTEREAAQFLGLEPSTLKAWRWRGEGPSYAKFGRAVRYSQSTLFKYAERSVKSPGSQHAA